MRYMLNTSDGQMLWRVKYNSSTPTLELTIICQKWYKRIRVTISMHDCPQFALFNFVAIIIVENDSYEIQISGRIMS